MQERKLLTAYYLRKLHPELTRKECYELLIFANSKTIYERGCYGKGSKIYPLFIESLK